MEITEERIKRITEQAASMKAIGRASVDISSELEFLVSDNAAMEAKIQGLEEANARLRERLNRGENHDACMKLPLDADGVPIRIGDEVNVDGDAMTVLGYRHDDTLLLIAKDRKSGLFFSPEPSRVRHFKYVPADSWEKLEQDVSLSIDDYWTDVLGREYTFCTGDKVTAKASDIVRRAKKLAGIEKLEGEER